MEHQGTVAESTAGDFADELSAHLARYGDRPFIEFERRWYSGDEVTQVIDAVTRLLDDNAVPSTAPIGLVARNRPPHAAAALGLIAARRPVAMIYSYQSVQSIARDIVTLAPAVVIADRQDWTETTLAAARGAGCGAIALSLRPLSVELLVRPAAAHLDTDSETSETPGLHILSSGTTGPPKRLPLRTDVLSHTVASMTMGMTGCYDDPPELVYWPFGSVGVCQLLAAPFLDKRMVLLEKFTVDDWVRAIKTYRIRRAGVQPALLRMLLDADVPKEDLASIEYLPGGSGPLEPELRDSFESKYGIPLMWAYGATEFAGSVCAWTPDDHRRHGADKTRSVGRPLPGVHVRVVDPETGVEVATGEVGHLEGRVDVIGPDWIRTTDLASIDADGFVYLHGRGDGAINRGGFKILPETVRAVLIRHPAVLDVSVVGVPDDRLGQVPFAAVELRRGSATPSEDELKDLVRESLPSHHVPVEIAVVDELPRNAAWKVTVRDVAALYPIDR
ncbi:ANL family adenylate-forming protein [Gordonia sp. SL306]|uniref:ANL family adenylate-forming protein n=1 Tax=Gordonia sp. SL306 TaxID=2995145 RepID=UPI00226EA806|nr:fatty acid--CoA ligase family protein [Gordonia sp. SL306]WAC57060.1 fatty acid--CoA ligase family protein [Gordonia sp. SL306]